MLHVCIDARLYHAAGIGTLLKAALASLSAEARHRITLLCCDEDKMALSAWGYPTITMRSPIYSLHEQIEYPSRIPSCDLFWSPHFNVPLLPIRARKRLVTVCDVYHLAHYSSLTLFQKCYAKLMYNAAFCLSDCVTTISEFSKREIFSYASWKPQEVKIMSPGLDHFPPLCSVGSKDDFLLCVGNLKPHKNLVRLVQAYDRLRPEEPLFIVGKKEGLITADNALMKVVEKSSYLQRQIHFTGQVSDTKLQELYAKAKLLIFPSTYEGFGYPPLEAMAFGCPVVASRAASIPEICQDAVEYVDPFSVDSIAAGIGRLLLDPKRREELTQKGRSLFEKKKQQKNLIGEVIDACCDRS